MAIKMLAPAIKTFNPLPAIHHWNNMSEGTRRPFYKDNIKSKLHTLELQTPQPQVTASGDSEVKMAENSDEEPDEPEVEVAGVSAAQEDGKYFDSDSSDSDYDSGLEEDMVFAKLTRSM